MTLGIDVWIYIHSVSHSFFIWLVTEEDVVILVEVLLGPYYVVCLNVSFTLEGTEKYVFAQKDMEVSRK